MKKYLTYEKLSVFFDNLKNLFAVKTDLNSHKEDTSIHITSTERTNWNSAKTHADSAHAPSDAQPNVIESVKVNGTALTPSSKAVNITVPTKVSELTNDSGYKTTDNNTTYSLSKTGSTITLTGSDGSTASVTDSDTTYTLPTASSSTLGGVKIGTNVNISNETISVANGSTSAKGIVQLTDSTSSTSTTTAATPNSVKSAYDRASTAITNAATAQSTADSKIGSVSIASGTNNGTIKLTVDDTTTDNIAVKGLGSAAYTASSAYATSAQGTKADNAMPKSGGTFTGSVTLNADPTANLGAATKQYVDSSLSTAKSYADTKVANLVGTAPETLDTLEEVAAAIEAHQDVTDALNSAIGNKVDKVSGKGLSTNDYTTTEKNKLSGIASGAEVNQNAFSNIAVGSTTVAADSKTDTLTLVAGSNVTLTADATNDKITIASKDTVYSHPTYTSKSSGLYKITVDGTGHVSDATAVAKSDITALGIPGSDTTYGVATSSALGLVKSGTDITVDSSGNVSVNDDSHNHVISNVDGLQSALDGKLTKTTYEYNKELALGSSGKVCIGVFPCYNSNISVEIKSTTNTTYHGTLIIATQNINTSLGGVYSATVYGDENNTLTSAIKIQYLSGSNAFSIYINLPSWSKNILHIQCVSLAGTPNNIATVVDSIPSTATIVPTNAFTHTHNYAGSSSAGGSATSAVKLDSSAGSATQPVYFSGGKPVACTYTLGKSVPSDAVFTDTNTDTKNTAGSSNTSSKIYLIGATSQATNPQTYSHDTAYVGTNGCLYSGGNRVATEIISTSEPSGQTTGDFWMLAY